MLLLEFPVEIINLIVEKLELQAFLKFCASCSYFRSLFTIESLAGLAKSRIDAPIKRLHYVSRYHLLVFHFGRMRVSELQIFVNSKASPGINKLLEDTFRNGGTGRNVDFLIQYGASLSDVPCGIHKLLEDTFRDGGTGRNADFLIQHGASLSDVPCGIHKLLEDTFRDGGTGRNVDFLIQHGASLSDVPCGIHKLLEDTFRDGGIGQNVDFLIQNGACRRLSDERTLH